MAGPRVRAVAHRLPGVAGAGLAGWLVDVTVLWVGHTVLAIDTAVAAAAGFGASGVVNYTLNRRLFSGHHLEHPGRLRRYGLLFAANLAVVTAAVPLLADGIAALSPSLPVPLLAAKVVVTAVLLPVNTVIYGSWVFRNPAQTRVDQ